MKRFLIAAVSVAAFSHTAFAADQDYADDSFGGLRGVSGNLHVGTRAFIDKAGSDIVFVPELRLGGKVAIEPVENNFGLQLDLEYGGVPFSLVKPEVGADGSYSDFLGVAHATYSYNDFIKLGVFGGFERLSLDISNVDEDILTSLFTLDPGSVEANLSANMWQAGLEAMIVVDDTSSLQIRTGLVSPYKLSGSASTAAGVETGSLSQTANDVLGWQFGLGYRTAFDENWSVRADVNYTRFLISGSDDLAIWNWLATTQYAFSDMPLALTASAGYLHTSLGSDAEYGFIGRTSLIWSFGEPNPGGTRGKLFKSVNFQGDIN